MAHDEYWKRVKEDATKRLRSLFPSGERGEVMVANLVGDANGIDDMPDVHKVLAYTLKHGTSDEAATAVLAATDWQMSCHELAEHVQAGA